jgi:hypothetical protein
MKKTLLVILLLHADALQMRGDDLSNVEVETDGVVFEADGSVSLLGAPKPPAKKKKDDDEDYGNISENMDSDTGAMGFMTF